MYGDSRNLRYFVGLGLVIILLFVVIALIMRSGGDSKVPETKRELTSYVDDTNFSVSQTIIGPITATQNHNQVQITVTNTGSSIEVSQGYDGNVIASNNYPLSTNGFSEFLNALDRAGFTKGETAKDLQNDKGFCPTGQRFIFEIHDGANLLQRFWQTSCGGTKSYRGNFALTNTLFQAQIPDYDSLTEDANIN